MISNFAGSRKVVSTASNHVAAQVLFSILENASPAIDRESITSTTTSTHRLEHFSTLLLRNPLSRLASPRRT